MTNFILALAGILALVGGLQTLRLQQAQEDLQQARATQATQVAQVRHTRVLRAKSRLAGASAAAAASIAGSAPESWANTPIPEEIHEALRSFDGHPAGGLQHDHENPTPALD